MSNREPQANPRYKKPEAVKLLEALSIADTKKRFPNFPYPPKPKYRDDTANGLTKCVIDFICLNGYQAERINSMGAIKDTRKTTTDVIGRSVTIGGVQWIKSQGTNGTADISATIKGRSVKIEIKIGNDRQSQAQKDYQAQIERSGGCYLIVKDFTAFYDWFNLKTL